VPALFTGRFLLAATVLLALFTSAYELALLPTKTLPSSGLRAESGFVALAVAERKMLATPLRQSTPVATSELPPCPAEPIRFVALDPMERRPMHLHRYVGTVGGQLATVLLQWPTILGGIEGNFYLHRGGPQYALALREGLRHQPVFQLRDRADPDGDDPGTWHLTGWPNSVLRGTWHDSTGTRPFLLRESYAGGVQVAVHTLRLEGGRAARASYSDDSPCSISSYYYDYLQFPASRTVAPALRRAIGLPPLIVRRRLRAAYEEGYNERRELAEFLLDDFNLLSYLVVRGSTLIVHQHGDTWMENYLFDLVSGRELSLASQLRPGYERPLRRLVQWHLRHERQFDFINRAHRATWAWQDSTGKPTRLVALPKAEHYDKKDHATRLLLMGSGLEVCYPAYSLYDSDEPGGREHTITIPYIELRPLVRPGTPLARMLRARGL
jgi:hypothetical protein